MDLKKKRMVKLAYNSGMAFYTLPKREFKKGTSMMTPNHMGVSDTIIDESLLRQTPIYKWLKNRPTKQQSLHDIRLTFNSQGIWNILSKIEPTAVNPNNKDILLPTLAYDDDINVIVTVHHTDTISVAIACSCRPIALNIADIIRLIDILIRIELHLQNLIGSHSKNGDAFFAKVPSSRTWMVKLWHIGIDTIDTYEGKEFHVTFEEGISDLCWIYSKGHRNENKKYVRIERQENPNQPYYDALVRKLFPNGRLAENNK